MQVWKYLKNKYVITTLVFILWLLFFDKNNMGDQRQHWLEYNKLKDQSKYYENEKATAKKDRDEIFTSPKTLEKFAREKYMMK